MSVGPREVGGGGGSSLPLFNSSTPTQGSHTITFLAFEATTSVIVVTSTSMNTSRVVSTTPTTITISATRTAIVSSTPIISPFPASQNDMSFSRDALIIASVLGGFTILLICTLAIIYWIYRRRKRQRELDYSPPFTSLAPPPRTALSPHSMRSSPVPPEEAQETSLSMGPGIYTTEPTHRRSHSATQQQQQQPPRPNSNSDSHTYSLPEILLQPSSPSPIDNPPGRPRAQSRLYHDLLREETEGDAARRYGRPNAPGASILRPISAVSDISGVDAGQLQPSSEVERGRGFPSTRASSGVFPDD